MTSQEWIQLGVFLGGWATTLAGMRVSVLYLTGRVEKIEKKLENGINHKLTELLIGGARRDEKLLNIENHIGNCKFKNQGEYRE